MPRRLSIEDILNQLDAKMLEKKEADPDRRTLASVISLLINVHNKDEAGILFTLDYLRNIVFSNESNGPKSKPLSLRQFLGLKESSKQATPSNDIPLAQGDIQFFADIYRNLLAIYKNIISWEYKFPINKETSSADHPVLKKWCEELTLEEHHTTEKNQDLNRGIGLFGTRPRSATDAERLLSEKIQETTYSAEQKSMLEKWVKTNGDQRIYSIISDLTMNRFLSDQFTLPGFTNTIGANFYIKNGEVQFFFAIDYYSLHDENHNHLVMLKNHAAKTLDPGDTAEQYKGGACSPLLRAEVRLEFNVTADKVTPRISDIHLTSYTEALNSPANNDVKPASPFPR